MSYNIFLKNIRDEFLVSKNIIVHNKKPTFHRKNQISCIDHIHSNCASHINNVTTSKNILSDHNYIYCTYSNQKFNLWPSYTIKRDFSLLTRYNLQQYFYNNTEIQSVFYYKDTNYIAETIINQMDIIKFNRTE